jgi:predicted signal transduction protein with EAL and GGDEF domain
MAGRPQQVSPLRRAALIAIIYTTAAELWMTLSDILIEKLLADPGGTGTPTHNTHGTTPEQLFRMADQAMYTAKQKGRNLACIAA